MVGYATASKTSAKILQCRFYWPTLFRDVPTSWQLIGNLLKANVMPMAPILAVDIFEVWGIDFQGPYPSSIGKEYIMVVVDYISKWVENIVTKTNYARVVTKFFKKRLFFHVLVAPA